MRGMIVLLCAALAPQLANSADVYSCKGENGSISYSQSPCGDNAQKIKIKVHNKGVRTDYSRSELTLIAKGQIVVGMSKSAVIRSWGRPDKINRSAYGSDQWVYDRGSNGSQYVYIENGKVTNWN